MADINLSGSIGSGGAFPILGKANVQIVGNVNLVLLLAQYSNFFLQVTSDGTSTGILTVVLPLIEGEIFAIENNTSEGFAINTKAASGNGPSIPSGATAIVICDGTNYLLLGLSTSGATPWKNVAAGATVAVPSQQSPLKYAIDASAAQVSMDLPVTPIDGQTVLFKITSNATVAPVLLVAGGTTTIENPGNPGNFSAAGGTVAMAGQGQLFGVTYQATGTRWIQSN